MTSNQQTVMGKHLAITWYKIFRREGNCRRISIDKVESLATTWENEHDAYKQIYQSMKNNIRIMGGLFYGN